MRVLAIDDSQDNLVTLRAVLSEALPGCELLTATVGLDGIEQARVADPDVILLDVVMPGLDGYAVCRQLKADAALREIPVLFLTALRSARESRFEALDAGAEGFLAKPLDAVELTAQIRAMARLRAVARQQRLESERLATLVGERTRELEHELAERRRVEDAVRLIEARLRNVVHYARCILWSGEVIDRPGWQAGAAEPRFLWSIDIQDEVRAQAILPLDVSDGKPYCRAWLESRDVSEAASRGAAAAAALLGGADHFGQEFHCTDRHGVVHCLHEEVTLRPLAVGRWEAYGVITDVTERRRAEAELRVSEGRYRELVQNANSAIIRWRRDGTITFFNECAQSLFGYSAAAAVGEHVGIIVPGKESTGADLSTLIQDIVEHPERYVNTTNENVCRDGRRLWMAWTNRPVFDERGQVTEILAVGSDITARVEAEQALRQQTERLRNLHRMDQAILQAAESPEAIAQTALLYLRDLLQCQRPSVGIFDAARKEVRILAVDASGAAVAPVARALADSAAADLAVLQHGTIEIVEDMSRRVEPPVVARVLEVEGLGAAIHVPLRSAQGLYGALNIGWTEPRSIAPEEVEIAGEVARQLTLAIEQARLLQASRRHAAELEQRVAERTAQLEAANQELEAFSYSVSHDLRGPLRAVDGYARILEEDYGTHLDAEGQRVCAVIRQSARDMGRLIDDLLAFSRVGRTALQPAPVDMATLARSIFFELTSPADRERIDFHVGLLPFATGDPTLLRQVWLNLLANALKFSGKKERSLIEVGFVGRAEGGRQEAEGGYYVRDNGAGFDRRYAHKLFGVFQRLHSSKEFEGTGVGLAIVQRIVHRHGGRVWAAGESGVGATFYFTVGEAGDGACPGAPRYGS